MSLLVAAVITLQRLFSSAVSFFFFFFFFFFNAPATPEIYTLSLPDALPILDCMFQFPRHIIGNFAAKLLFATLFYAIFCRSEEHTSELQSRSDLVCRLLLEKKNWRNEAHVPMKTHVDHDASAGIGDRVKFVITTVLRCGTHT